MRAPPALQDLAMETPQITDGSIVAGVDGSDDARRALAWAADEAALEGRRLVVVHATGEARWHQAPGVVLDGVDAPPLREAVERGGRELLEEAVQAVRARHPDVDVDAVLDERDPRIALVQASRAAHLVVVGSRGRGPLRSLLGSVSIHVSKHADCPVVVCRPRAGTPGTGVLVGVGGVSSDDAALAFAFTLASFRGEPLTVMHCYWEVGGPGPEAGPDADVARLVAEAVAGLRERWPDVPVTLEGRRGLVDVALSDEGSTREVIVVGRPEDTTALHLLYGSTAVAVLERAHATVAVVPARS